MFNYIQAEFYKLLHRKYTYIVLGAMLVLESLLAAAFAFHNSHSFATPFGAAVSTIAGLGSVGIVTCLLTGDIVFAGQYKNSTLKNEVSFGLSRTQIYLGKLITQTLLSLLYLVVMLGFFVGLCAVVLPHNLEGFPTDAEGLIIVGYFLAAGLPIWIGTQAAACMCLFLVNGDTAAAFTYVGLVFLLEPAVQIAGYLLQPNRIGDALLKAVDYFPVRMLGNAAGVVGDWSYLGLCWLVGASWLAVCTAAGLYGFSRKEIQ